MKQRGGVRKMRQENGRGTDNVERSVTCKTELTDVVDLAALPP